MKLVDWYNSASEMKKNIFLLSVIALIGLAATFIFFFLNNPGVSLGWLLGSAIEIICYITIVKGTSFLLDPKGLDKKRAILAPVFMLLRLALYAGGLVLAAFCTFRWGSNASSYLNFWAVFAGYMPMVALLLFTTLLRLRKPKTEPSEIEEKPEEDEAHD